MWQIEERKIGGFLIKNESGELMCIVPRNDKSQAETLAIAKFICDLTRLAPPLSTPHMVLLP
jgi:hypothetical protein